MVIWVGIAFLVLMAIIMWPECAKVLNYEDPASKPLSEVHQMDGSVIYDRPRGSGLLVREKNGTVREATVEEEATWAAITMSRMKEERN